MENTQAIDQSPMVSDNQSSVASPNVNTSQPQAADPPPNWNEITSSKIYQKYTPEQKQYVLDHWHADALAAGKDILGKDDIMHLNNFAKDQSQIISNSDVSMIGGIAHDIVQGGTFNQANKLVAGVESLNPFSDKTYDENLRDENQKQAIFNSQHPYIGAAADIAGNLTLPIGAVTKALGMASKGVPIVGKMAGYLAEHPNQANALTGAGLGGVQGYANTGTLRGALTGAEVGGTVGAIASPVSNLAGNIIGGGYMGARRVVMGAPKAEELIGNFLKAPGALEAAQANLEADPTAVLSDEPTLQKFTRKVLKEDPTAAKNINQNLLTRSDNSVSRVQNSIGEWSDPYLQAYQDHVNDIKQESDVAWQKLFEDKTPLLTPDMAELLENPEIQAAAKAADAKFRSDRNPDYKGLANQSFESLKIRSPDIISETPPAVALPKGYDNLAPYAQDLIKKDLAEKAAQNSVPPETPDFANDFQGFPIEYAHEIKMQLDDKARQAYEKGDDSTGRIYNGFSKQWRGALDDATGGEEGTYATARAVNQPLQQIESVKGGPAMEGGKLVNKQSLADQLMAPNMRPDQVEQKVNGYINQDGQKIQGLTNLQKIQLKLDLADKLRNEVGNKNQNIGKGDLYNPNKQSKIETIINAPDNSQIGIGPVLGNGKNSDYERFMQVIQQEKNKAYATGEVVAGSPSDINLATGKQLTSKNILNPSTWADKALDLLSRNYQDLNKDKAIELSNILTTHQQSLDAVNNLSAARQNQLIPQILQKTIQNLYEAFLRQSVPVQAVNAYDSQYKE